MSTVASQLHEFIADETGISADEFGTDTQLFSGGYIDSFTMTAVIAFIEETFDVEIPQSAITLENFDTIDSMVAFIAREKE